METWWKMHTLTCVLLCWVNVCYVLGEGKGQEGLLRAGPQRTLRPVRGKVHIAACMHQPPCQNAILEVRPKWQKNNSGQICRGDVSGIRRGEMLALGVMNPKQVLVSRRSLWPPPPHYTPLEHCPLCCNLRANIQALTWCLAYRALLIHPTGRLK